MLVVASCHTQPIAPPFQPYSFLNQREGEGGEREEGRGEGGGEEREEREEGTDGIERYGS